MFSSFLYVNFGLFGQLIAQQDGLLAYQILAGRMLILIGFNFFLLPMI
jgi:hypothetical protein